MHAYDASGGAASEMAIVDTFTRLIFGEEEHFDHDELLVIEALRQVDTGVARDSHREMGQYLRALGVAEMIQLVTRVQACLSGSLHRIPQGRGSTVLDRRAH